MYKLQLQHQIKDLEVELGERMSSLEAHRPYKDLTPANHDAYVEQYEKILEIEKQIEIKNNIVKRLDTPMDYDDHLDTGMDTSININEYEDNTKNE
jgi:hypothetical protein